MTRYVDWWQKGYLSSTGRCFDIGVTVARALERFRENGDPFAGSTDRRTAGNGSLMRLAPVVLFYFPSLDDVIHFSGESSRTTHAAPEAIECCKLLGLLLTQALFGSPKGISPKASSFVPVEPKVAAIMHGAYAKKSREQIFGTGYCVASLEAALWCFHHTTSFEAAVLAAANLGDDADTTAAIVGQLAGAHYGVQAIPDRWLARLHMRTDIKSTAEALHARAASR
jgi:ADP-ribosyl-[dinitrogen reductase] hydrolase